MSESGVTNSYGLCARARLFRRDVYKMNNVTKFEKFMGNNNYKSDRLQNNNPSCAFFVRGVLRFNFNCDFLVYNKTAREIKNQIQNKRLIIAACFMVFFFFSFPIAILRGIFKAKLKMKCDSESMYILGRKYDIFCLVFFLSNYIAFGFQQYTQCEPKITK